MKITYTPHHFLVATYGDPYRAALEEAGHEIVTEGGDVLFTDGDWPWNPWLPACDTHERVILFPHGAGIPSGVVGARPRHPHTVGQIVTGDGFVDLAAHIDDIPTVACGWPWFELGEFTPSARVGRIFMAPAHPMNNDGADWYAAGVLDAWRDTGRALLIRYPGARWDISTTVHSMGETLDSIRWNDLTVTQSSTVAGLAVAAGKPCIMNVPAAALFADFCGPNDLAPPRLERDVYAMTRFPFGLDDIDEALRFEPVEWRARWCGGRWDPDLFVKTFESFALD